jgi:serine/threonine protein kinase
MWRAFKRKGGPAAPASPASKATPKERRQDSPPKQAPKTVAVEVIPKTIWMEQELQQLRRAGEWPHMTAQRAERLLDVGTGEVVELEQLEEAFDLIEELGCGECAVVYRAEHRQDGVEMALKVLHFGSPGQGGLPNESAEATALAMARNELLSLTSLPRHQGIMQLLGVWCTSSQLAFGLELLDSGDLLVPIEESGGAIPEADALPLFAQLASGVRHMHANGDPAPAPASTPAPAPAPTATWAHWLERARARTW